ncbi:MAG: glycoside hydrolase family 2 TIM barrel-domain containing protein [Sedimentisphaerales bacterium]
MHGRTQLILLAILCVVSGGCYSTPGLRMRSMSSSEKPEPDPRRIIDLNGTWGIAGGSMDSIPESFTHKVPVPGLVDMAQPGFEEVGKKSPRRQAFWYRRTFTLDEAVPDIAILKIHKAKYGTKVFLNGQVVGEHLPCFTPALLDVKKFLKERGQENELIIRVGADRESLPEGMPTGWDFEKYLYIPGIYDSVELILTGAPYIARVQAAPDLVNGKVNVVANLKDIAGTTGLEVRFRLREVSTGETVRSGAIGIAGPLERSPLPVDFAIPIAECHLWTPEDPFLYELELWTVGDHTRTRFGMRSFHFDRQSGRAILNGRPYFMRGTNVCIYRFFEDAERGDKPWRAEWVRRLHKKFKSMHWNSIRYCIGFPPDIWYDIADEEGFLIQDEFPIWLLSDAPEKPVSEKIVPEYTEWMQERWNHPCVAIWDAQNESVTPETGKALQAVRHLDLSGRPWENGWAQPQSPNDCVESHPYLFSTIQWGRGQFHLSDLAHTSGEPHLRDAQKRYDLPIIINEYGWLWLNRDGTTTCLTDKVYDSLLGPNSTTEQRRLVYARYLAALTEFWRGHRTCAGVLHFCGLGYSRPGDKPRPEGGATSDHFIDLEKLTFEPHFERYVRDAFSPVGLMVDFWGGELAAGAEHEFKVYVINDLYDPWQGTVRFRMMRGDQTIAEQSGVCTVNALDRQVPSFTQAVPKETGDYQLVVELDAVDGKTVRSLRDFKVVSAE